MEETNNPVQVSSKSVTRLPSNQINLAVIAQFVAEQWINKFPNFSAYFVTSEELQIISQRFASNVSSKSVLLGKRKVITKTLSLLCKGMDKNVVFLKNYLREEFGSEMSKSYYQSFGLVVIGKQYTLPADKDKRVLSLQNIVAEMAANPNLGNKKFGLTYWTQQLNDLQTNWQTAKQTDSQLSALTEHIHIDRPILLKYLSKLKQLIKINSGSTYKQAWRDWGFQAEKYK